MVFGTFTDMISLFHRVYTSRQQTFPDREPWRIGLGMANIGSGTIIPGMRAVVEELTEDRQITTLMADMSLEKFTVVVVHGCSSTRIVTK